MQTTHVFSNSIFWMKSYGFQLTYHWSFCLRVKSTIFQHWFGYLLGADKPRSHYLNQMCLVYWRIYAPLSLNELMYVSSHVALTGATKQTTATVRDKALICKKNILIKHPPKCDHSQRMPCGVARDWWYIKLPMARQLHLMFSRDGNMIPLSCEIARRTKRPRNQPK